MTTPYNVNCDPKTGICTATLKIARGRAYDIPAERQSDEIATRVKAGAEYKGYGLHIETRQVDSAARTILFVASTASKDRYGDTIQQDGWDMKAYMRNPVILFGHDSRSLPIGRAPKTFVEKGNLHALVEFATAQQYPFADTVFNMAAGGFLNAMSVGFIPLEFEYILAEPQEGEEPSPWPKIEGRNYTKCELLENSVVPIPANPEALVVGREFEAAFRAIAIEDEATVIDSPYEFERGERAYFALKDGSRSVVNFGSVNPADSKVVDADPYILVNHGCTVIKAGSEKKAARRALESLLKSPAESSFLCELVGSTAQGFPVYRSLYQILQKETSRTENSDMSCNCGKTHGAALCAECSIEKSVVPFHSYPLAPANTPWDAGKEMGSTEKAADWRKMCTIVLDDGTKKGDFKLPHHKGPAAKFATVRRGVANALARVSQVGGASAADKAGAKKHLLKHMAEFHKDSGKAFDEEAFIRALEMVEAFRDGAPVDAQEAITLRIVEFIEGEPEPELLLFAEAFALMKSAEAREETAKVFVSRHKIEGRKFSNESANKKLVKAQKSLHAAKAEMVDSFKEYGDMLDEAIKSVDNVVAGGGMKGMEEDTTAGKLADAHEKAQEVRREVARSHGRFRSHMITANKHLKDMCDYMGQDPEDTDPDEDVPASDPQDSMKDDESTATQADDQAATQSLGGEAEFLAELERQATVAAQAASNDVTAGTDPASETALFESLFEALSQGEREASKS